MINWLKKAYPVYLLFISMPGKKVFSLYYWDLHNVSNVEILYPLVLVQKTQNTPHVWLLLAFLPFFLIDRSCEGLIFFIAHKPSAYLHHYWVNFQTWPLHQANRLVKEISGNLFGRRWIHDHLDYLGPLIFFKIRLLVSCLQIFPIVNFVYVEFAELS